ncbi:hypothetical protein [Terrabacter carboxydivorans]|uniref:DUF732 domain-containing protein n=1 Tax=Terrabacter carboxydivorans TaxID=619730 RepID=A0ABN3LEV6_9MICO
MNESTYAVRRPPRRRLAVRAGLVGVVGVAALLALGACSASEPTLADLPADVASARPSISAEEASFVLAAEKLGASITGDTVDDDLQTGTTTCWALKNGGVDLAQIAVDDNGKPLPDTGDALRTKQLMAAGVQTFCPDYDNQVPQLKLP